ncbi:MAG: uroporphyrinogen-III synthase [Amphiplicatus sp.]
MHQERSDGICKTQVIVTRPAPDGEAFARALEAAGMSAILSPVIEIVPREERPALDGVAAIAFTSANGARAFARNAAAPPIPAFAVGAMTAAAARAAGFDEVHAATGDVAGLARLIAAHRPAGDVLHICGDDRAGDLAGLLAEAGLAARRLVLYKAKPAEGLSPAALRAIGAGAADYVALFSPRSARLFVAQAAAAGLVERLSTLHAACLSEAVAAAARAPFRSFVIPAERTAASMIARLRR